MKKYAMLFVGLSLLFASCSDNDDSGVQINPGGPSPTASNVVVQNFMWQALNVWYFWQADAPNLGDNRFNSDEDYTAYLESFPNPSDFFFNTCYNHRNVVGDAAATDRFSFLAEDYRDLVNGFAGVSRSNGLEFGLIALPNDDVIGIVRYVIPNSDASTKSISRGDIFGVVDGQTLNRSNFSNLLFGNNDSYTLTLGTVNDSNQFVSNNQEVSLTKLEGLVENPVFITKSFDVNGQRIGYLMYNSFTRNFDEELNAAFGQLKADGVTDLVLDFRYNGGGSVNSSRLLASMVHGTNTNELYLRQRWNDRIQASFNDEDLEDYFASTTGAGTAINTLNLSRVYVIGTGSTASASELVMNGLDPYINVIHVGTTTSGKNEFSITLVDDPDRPNGPYIYSESRANLIPSDSEWAIQPLVGRNENADGFLDYIDGFTPDIELREDILNYGVLGELDEPLLARAIQDITGVTAKARIVPAKPMEVMTSSKMYTVTKDNMYLDKEFTMILPE